MYTRLVYDINQHPLSLLVAEDGFQEVQQQIEDPNKTSRKPTEEFRVVLPLSYEHRDSYPFKFYTMGQFFSNLIHLLSSNRRRAEHHESNHRTSQSVSGKLDNTTVNLVLLGLSGTGKSSSGNTILGKKQFVSKVSSVSVTTECQEAETEIDGLRVRVIDTPDIFDDDVRPSDKNKHVSKVNQLCQSGPRVFLLVMHVSRFTDRERDILKKMEDGFDDRVSEQTVILFTRGDDLQNAEMTLEDFLSSCQPELKRIVGKCGDRCVVFENRNSDSHQVKELMKTVNRLLDRKNRNA